MRREYGLEACCGRVLSIAIELELKLLHRKIRRRGFVELLPRYNILGVSPLNESAAPSPCAYVQTVKRRAMKLY